MDTTNTVISTNLAVFIRLRANESKQFDSILGGFLALKRIFQLLIIQKKTIKESPFLEKKHTKNTPQPLYILE